MAIRGLMVSLALLAAGPVFAQGAFVDQASPGFVPGGMLQAGESGGAYVVQAPDARPVAPRVPAAAAAPVRAVRSFLTPLPVDGEAPPLILNADPGVESYPQGQRPRVPTIGAGAAVALTVEGLDSLPSVGAGVVNL